MAFMSIYVQIDRIASDLPTIHGENDPSNVNIHNPQPDFNQYTLQELSNVVFVPLVPVKEG